MTAFGKSKQREYQEYFRETRITGLFAEDLWVRESEPFRRKISAVIFITDLKPGALNKSFVAINPARDTTELIKRLSIFRKLNDVEPAS